MYRTTKIITATAFVSFAVAACGGSDAPSIDQIKADFENPSGSTKDKQSVAGAYSKQNSSQGAAGFAAGGFAGGGFGLTAADTDKLAPFARFQPNRILAPALRARAMGYTYRGLSEAQTGACFTQADLIGGVSPGDTSGSFSSSKDLSTCAEGMTGTLSIDGEWEVDTTAQSFRYKIEYTYANVCVTADNLCIDGSMAMEMESGGSTTGTANFSLIAGWFYTLKEGTKTYETKGGMRLAANESGAGRFEYLVYVKDSSGNEVSLVISYETDGQGNAVLKIRGDDGSITCTVSADGSGACDGDLNWTAEDAETFGAIGYD